MTLIIVDSKCTSNHTVISKTKFTSSHEKCDVDFPYGSHVADFLFNILVFFPHSSMSLGEEKNNTHQNVIFKKFPLPTH